ncbi:creatininase family protein [Streptomyces tricolor]|nr:creatininase family protein [Streptomyces tricolor]
MFAFSWWSLVRDTWTDAEIAEFPGWHAEHAGVTETSLMLHLHPDLVTAERPDHDRPPRAGVYLHPVDVEQISNRGILSSTSGSSAALGGSCCAMSSTRPSPWCARARGCSSPRPAPTAAARPATAAPRPATTAPAPPSAVPPSPEENTRDPQVPSRLHLQLHPRRLAGPPSAPAAPPGTAGSTPRSPRPSNAPASTTSSSRTS